MIIVVYIFKTNMAIDSVRFDISIANRSVCRNNGNSTTFLHDYEE